MCCGSALVKPKCNVAEAHTGAIYQHLIKQEGLHAADIFQGNL